MTSLDSSPALPIIDLGPVPEAPATIADDCHALIAVARRERPGGRGGEALRPTLQARLAIARYNVNLRLEELEGRLFDAKRALDPRTWKATPWAEVGAALLVGYWIGRSRLAGSVVGLVMRAGVKVGRG